MPVAGPQVAARQTIPVERVHGKIIHVHPPTEKDKDYERSKNQKRPSQGGVRRAVSERAFDSEREQQQKTQDKDIGAYAGEPVERWVSGATFGGLSAGLVALAGKNRSGRRAHPGNCRRQFGRHGQPMNQGSSKQG